MTFHNMQSQFYGGPSHSISNSMEKKKSRMGSSSTFFLMMITYFLLLFKFGVFSNVCREVSTLHQSMIVEQMTLKVHQLLEETCGGQKHLMGVIQLEMRVRLSFSSSLVQCCLFGIQPFFYLFIYQVNICFGMGLIGRYGPRIMLYIKRLCVTQFYFHIYFR